MIGRAALIALAVAVAGGLTAASAGGAAAAVPRPACARPAVVKVESFGFHPASVRPGGSSTATLKAVNCTGRAQQDIEVWFVQFTQPGGGLPFTCPVIDPFELPVRFPPPHRFHGRRLPGSALLHGFASDRHRGHRRAGRHSARHRDRHPEDRFGLPPALQARRTSGAIALVSCEPAAVNSRDSQ